MVGSWVTRAALGTAALLAGCMASSGREARVASHFGARRSCPTNEVKITPERTLVFVGKERLNQSLNFAIAAEMFWSP